MISVTTTGSEQHFTFGTHNPDQPPIRFVGDKDYPPIEWLEDDQAKGIYASFLPALANSMNRQIDYRLMNWKEAQNAVLEGNADVLTVFSPNPDRIPHYDFTPGFFDVEMSLFVRTDNVSIFNVHDLEGMNVGITKGGHLKSWLRENSKAKLVEVSNHLEGFKKLVRGEVDAVATTNWVGLYVLQKHHFQGVRPVEPALYAKPTHMGVVKGNHELIQALSSAVERMKDQGVLENLQQRWKGSQVVLFTKDYLDLVTLRIVFGVVAVLVIILLISVYLLKQQVRRRTHSLEIANNELETLLELQKHSQQKLIESEKLAALGTMVAGLAHELNTPIGIGVTITSTLEHNLDQLFNTLTQGKLKLSEVKHVQDESKDMLSLLYESLKHAADLTSDFKQLAADQNSMQRRVFNLAEVIQSIVTTMEHSLKPDGIEISNTGDASIEIDGYPGAITQILNNLLINAFIHAFEDEESGRITINFNRHDDQIVLVVSDNGKGIPEENLDKLFNPFFTTRLGQGSSGLGLSIVYNLVTGIMGGDIKVSIDSGTQFNLTFPSVAPVHQSTHTEE
jgi:signal transduction histidine kinase